MEELFAYALLFSVGYDVWGLYTEQLDKLFLEYPENEEYIYLEGPITPKEATLHIISIMSSIPFNTDIFGQTLMKLIAQVYATSDLKEFGKTMYSLWNRLPAAIIQKEPFWTFSYADDCLSFGDEKQCRELYEKAIHYYD